MNAIEKQARELLAAEYRKAGANPAACELMAGRASWPNQMALNAIAAALMLGRPVDLLDQDGASLIEAQELQVVPSAAFGADEAGSVGINQVAGGLPRDVELAEIASEHGAGVRPEGDGQATADHVAHNLKMVERVAKAMQAAEQAQTGWVWEDCSLIEVEGWMDLARAAIAALTPPEGYVLMPVEPTEALLNNLCGRNLLGCNDEELRAAYVELLAARPEVRRG